VRTTGVLPSGARGCRGTGGHAGAALGWHGDTLPRSYGACSGLCGNAARRRALFSLARPQTRSRHDRFHLQNAVAVPCHSARRHVPGQPLAAARQCTAVPMKRFEPSTQPHGSLAQPLLLCPVTTAMELASTTASFFRSCVEETTEQPSLGRRQKTAPLAPDRAARRRAALHRPRQQPTRTHGVTLTTAASRRAGALEDPGPHPRCTRASAAALAA
jgi:hypothetical protein